jgi:hypothetical protein
MCPDTVSLWKADESNYGIVQWSGRVNDVAYTVSKMISRRTHCSLLPPTSEVSPLQRLQHIVFGAYFIGLYNVDIISHL